MTTRAFTLVAAALALAAPLAAQPKGKPKPKWTPESAFEEPSGKKKKPKKGEKPDKGDKTDKSDKSEKPTPDKSGRLKLRVLDVAGGRAYLDGGADSGLRVGDSVKFGNRNYTVVATSPSSAAVELGHLSLELGATGTTTIDPNRQPGQVEPVAKPPPLTAYRSTWPGAVVPATTQHPKSIPLGAVVHDERSSVAFGVGAYAVLPTGGSGSGFVETELRGVLHYEPFVEMPLGFDADIAAQTWIGGDMSARPGNDSRPLVRLRALQAAYGNEGAFLAALGRLRYASSTLGPVDGVRVRAPLFDGAWISAFGGLIPDPLSALPASQASRFGGELGWEDPMAAWRPRVVLGGHLSRFGGALDERRVDAMFDMNPEFGRMGLYAEASFFDKNNPWNAQSTELTAAGADASFRAGPLELGGRVSMQRPERSRYLASLLPPEWLCVQRTALTPNAACFGNDAVYLGMLDAGLRFDKVSATFGGSTSRTLNTESQQTGGFGNLRLLDLIGRMRLDTGFMGSRGTLFQTAAVSVSPGIVVWDGMADLSLRYRPALLRYAASTQAFVEHSVGGAVWLSPSPHFDLTFDGDWVTGEDVKALLVQTAMVWRTGF